VPTAAVFPATVAYVKVVIVKKLVVGSLVGAQFSSTGVQLLGAYSPPHVLSFDLPQVSLTGWLGWSKGLL